MCLKKYEVSNSKLNKVKILENVFLIYSDYVAKAKESLFAENRIVKGINIWNFYSNSTRK